MKVALVIDRIGGGGGEVFTEKLVRGLEGGGDVVEVLSGEKGDIVTERIPFSNRGSLFRLIGIWRSSGVLKDKLGRIEPDLVLMLSPVAAISTMMSLPEDHGYKTVYAPRYLALDHWKMISGEPIWRFNRSIESMALNFSYDEVFALSENMKGRIREAGAKSPIEIIPIGVDAEKFRPKGGEGQKPTFLFVGRFEPEKGYDLFLKIAERVEDARFVMVGDGTENLESVPPNVEVRGRVPHSEMIEVYNEATALLLTSYTEGLPRVCLESLACGTPVVGSRVGGVPDLVIDGETGFLVEPGNLDHFVAKARKFVDDPDLSERMGMKGRKHILENYEEKTTMERTIEELGKVAEDC